MLDNNPYSGFINAWRQASSSILQFVSDRLEDLADFVGLDEKPATQPIQPSFVPPFTGGQCLVAYNATVRLTFQFKNGSSSTVETFIAGFSGNGTFGAIRGFEIDVNPDPSSPKYAQYTVSILCRNFAGTPYARVISAGLDINVQSISAQFVSLSRADGQPDNCGNLPNPNPNLPSDYGAFGSGNPDDGQVADIVASGLPIPTVAGILAALKALADAVGSVADVLDGVRKIGDAVGKIADLLEQIFGDKKDRDREKPKYRRYAVGKWYELKSIDGFIPATPVNLNGVEAIPYKIQVVVESFPSTASRVLGDKSPSVSIDSLPLFYLLLQEDDYGVTSVKPIRTLNSSTSIPPFHRGVFWNFRLNPSIKAKYRFFYQTEQIEEEVTIQ